MNKKIFQNDTITGNSLIGFEIKGTFKKEEDELILLLSPVLNREILYSNIEYKLLEPTDKNAVLIKDGDEYIIKTPLYNYFEAIYIMPKLFECLYSNLYMNVPLSVPGDLPGGRVAGSPAVSPLRVLRNPQAVVQHSCTMSHPRQQTTWVPVSPRPRGDS